MECLRITFVVVLGRWKSNKVHYLIEGSGKALSEENLSLGKSQLSEILPQTVFYISSFLPAVFCLRVFSPSLLTAFPHFTPHCYSRVCFLARAPAPF